MCNTPVIYCRFLKIGGVAKKVNNPFQPSGVFAGLFYLLCLKTRFFDDPGVKSSSEALNKNNNQPQQPNMATFNNTLKREKTISFFSITSLTRAGR